MATTDQRHKKKRSRLILAVCTVLVILLAGCATVPPLYLCVAAHINDMPGMVCAPAPEQMEMQTIPTSKVNAAR